MLKSDLIDLVIAQIKRDILDEEIGALEELLQNIDEQNLKNYLPEKEIHEL
jgi:hypothetical protein